MSYCPKVTEFTRKLIQESGLDTETHLKLLKNLKLGYEKIDFAYEFIKKTPIFLDIFGNSRIAKSNTISDDLRKRGNEYCFAEDYANSLECLTQSILNTESASESLASAYGDRALLLFRKNYYNECIQDIHRAFQLDCSKMLQDTLTDLREKATNMKSNVMPQFYNPIPQLTNKNPLCPSASDCIDIETSELVGRYFVAAKDVEVGEVLIVEKSFVHMVFPESQYLHCHECLSLCYNLIPCPKCTKALYCSEICIKQSWGRYHQYECNMIPIYRQLTLNFVEMSVIALNQVKLESNRDDKYYSDRFSEVEKLVTNEERRESINYFFPIIMSCIGFHDFKTNTNILEDFRVAEDTLKNLIYECIMIDSINSFIIKKFSDTDRSQKLAQGLFSFSSFFNHSCAPNCQFFHYGRHLVIRAVADIRKGEECSISYCGLFPFSTVEIAERQNHLRDVFFFECHCRACVETWPIFKFLPFGIREAEMMDGSEMEADENKSNSNQNFAGENEGLQNILVQLGKVQTHRSQALVHLQKKLIRHYKSMGNKIIDF